MEDLAGESPRLMYHRDMSTKTISVDLEAENLLWLQAQATADDRFCSHMMGWPVT